MGLLPSIVFCTCAVVGLFLYSAALGFLYEHSEVKQLTTAQYSMAVLYGVIFVAWFGCEAGFGVARMQPRYDAVAEDEQDLVTPELKEGEKSPAPTLHSDAKLFIFKASHLPILRLCAEFVGIMGFIYLCDRTTLVAKGPKYVNHYAFWAVNAAILLLAAFTLRGGEGTPAVDGHVKPLQRDQTEEWKGWMQIMFVLYHYFAEAPIYNAIRMYIAAYVWMTGFGNFSYYYIKKDFTAVRFTQMMWRLNFFVVFVCLTMNNEYMLYYICPMHTFFTWGVFIPLFMFKEYNDSFTVLFVKILCTAGVAVLLYDVPGVFGTVMAPFRALLDFHDPLHPENSPTHEWFFRSGLDHLVWVFGMFCAFSFPWLDSKLEQIESLPSGKANFATLTILGVATLLGLWWYYSYFSLSKREYNKVHPYTSFAPIFLYLVFRNLTEALRKRHLHLFAWCGKITLETYILQFHVWMKTTGINGSPKFLMVWFPGMYWTNFVVVSAVYIFLSFRVFHITAALRDWVIPKEGGAALGYRALTLAAGTAVTYGAGYVLSQSAASPQ